MQITTEKRREDIISTVHQNGKVKVSELSERYNISEVSIRKDLEALEAQGHLKRVHGGAVGLNKLYVNMDLSERYRTNADAKRLIAEKAAEFIDDNDTIFMNAGSTLTFVLRAIRYKKNINLITNSIQNATEAALYGSFNVILLGGVIDSKYQFTYGADAERQIEDYHAIKFLLSVDGMSADAGLTHYYSNETSLTRKMIKHSSKTIVVADHTKIGRSAFVRIADVNDVDILITNKLASPDELREYEKAGVKIYQA